MNKKSTFISAISGLEFTDEDKVSCKSIRVPILNLMKKEHPHLDASKEISVGELNIYREKYISTFLKSEVGELNDLHKRVLKSLADDNSLVSKVEDEPDNRTFGQKLADNVANFGGSWTFIIWFFVVILVWIGANAFLLLNKGFDPYPFILLNLILSCLASLQAPIIMMSQNRQEEKDRERAKKDYMINLKSELEIRMLDDKIDHLIMHQQQELIEIQKVQIEMMNDILNRIESKK
jgi:uncharacterized membrane protein